MKSTTLLLGVGGTGASAVRGICRAFGSGVRAHVVDTDAASGAAADVPFTLLGGSRLGGQGAGGEPGTAQAAFLDAPDALDAAFDGVRLVVLVAALGGGTGTGATGEILKRLRRLGIPTLLFATTPFAFEGAERARLARAAVSSLCQNANAAVVAALDDLVADAHEDNFKEALARAADTLATGIALFWRVIEKPGYVRFDAARLRRILANAGRARFAVATAVGGDRARLALDALLASPVLGRASGGKVRTVVCGVLAGDDLRLSELACVSQVLQNAFKPETVEIGTVNDEATFSGRLVLVVFVFEAHAARTAVTGAERALAPTDRFNGVDKTLHNDENLDVPTYLRRGITLER